MCFPPKVFHFMQHFIQNVAWQPGREVLGKNGDSRRSKMLRLTVSPEEYLMIGDKIKIVFLGGTKNHLRIMVDAPKEMNVLRSSVLEAQITDPKEREKLPKYYKEPEYRGTIKKSCRESGRNNIRKN